MEVLSWNDLVASDDRNVTLQVAFSPIHGCLLLQELAGHGDLTSPRSLRSEPVKVPDDEEEAYIDPRD